MFYTAIFNNYDIPSSTVDIVYNEDNDPLCTEMYSPLYRGKYYKMHPQEDECAWVDGSIELKDKAGLLDKFRSFNCDLVVIKHPNRSKLSQEFTTNFACNLEDEKKLHRLADYYIENGQDILEMPLYVGGIIYSRNRPEILKQWFDLTMQYTKRDQLTLPYIIEMNQDFNIGIIDDLDIYNNQYFKVRKHNFTR